MWHRAAFAIAAAVLPVSVATGQGTQATVEVNLYKGLKLTTSTGTSSSSGGNSSSVGLTYQFNY